MYRSGAHTHLRPGRGRAGRAAATAATEHCAHNIPPPDMYTKYISYTTATTAVWRTPLRYKSHNNSPPLSYAAATRARQHTRTFCATQHWHYCAHITNARQLTPTHMREQYARRPHTHTNTPTTHRTKTCTQCRRDVARLFLLIDLRTHTPTYRANSSALFARLRIDVCANSRAHTHTHKLCASIIWLDLRRLRCSDRVGPE